MVRSYLRHEPTLAYGLICSPQGRSLLSEDGKTAVVPALEDVLIWDVKTGQQMGMWHEVGHSSPVTALARNPSQQERHLYAVGYMDGSIRIWDSITSSVKLTLNGHKGAITALHFDQDGLTLASGSQDTNLILWDITAESGLFRLKGHRDAITDLHFIYASVTDTAPSTSTHNLPGATKKYLATTSKDGLLKLWDLSLQHCVETVLAGRGEIWSLTVLQDFRLSSSDNNIGALVLVGNSEGMVKAYEISKVSLKTSIEKDDGVATRFLIEKGEIDLMGTKRVTQMAFSLRTANTGQFLAVSGSDRSVEVFRLRSEEDVRKKMNRRRKRAKEKATKKQDGVLPEEAEEPEAKVTWKDRLEPYTIVRPNNGRLRSFAFASVDDANNTLKPGLPLLLALSNNSLEVHNLPAPKKGKVDKSEGVEATLSCAFDIAGHRSEVRALALSSDDSLLASADSAGSLKIWNTSTGRVLRTLPCGYALSIAWLPDDHHVIVGCKDGTLQTYNIPSGTQIEDIHAHQGPIWSVVVHPSGTSCLSASGDKDVKFWEFEAREAKDEEDEQARAMQSEQQGGEDEGEGENSVAEPKRSFTTLGLTHVRTLKMTDDILCARYSPDGRLLALSLLDSTVKVFYSDTLKFFLSLYGHKLPVLSLDISGDNKLCVTVSADKNAKIWGLDYGDCHRSLFAHEESIVGVAFEKGDQGGGLLGGKEGKSHHFWTCAKDGKLKYWDGDRFQCIQTMSGHHGDVTSLAVGSKGTIVASAGADRSIRIWEKGEDLLFLEEEREREMEEMYQGGGGGMANERNDDEKEIGSLAEGNKTEEEMSGGREVEGVHKSTKETLMAGERLMEAIEIADADLRTFREYEKSKIVSGLDLAPPPRHPLLANAFETGEIVDANAYVLKVTMKILPAQLDDALLVLPFDFVISLMMYLDYWASREWNTSLVSKILFFLLRNHHSQIVANRVMRKTLISLRGHLRAALRRQKMTIGYNVAGLNHVKSRLEDKLTGELYERQGFDIDEGKVKEILDKNQRRKRKVFI
ncbi:hypothetical protein CBS101457_003997 [Exobasidium rhododendri]|nr:hypothetical protein CBS101457_003997 [Exobasidium rhododendri]